MQNRSRAVRDRAGVHDIGGDDEQRHGQQDEAVVKPVHQHLARDADAGAAYCQVYKRGQQDRIGYRHADPGHHKQRDQAQPEFQRHLSAPPAWPPVSASSP